MNENFFMNLPEMKNDETVNACFVHTRERNMACEAASQGPFKFCHYSSALFRVRQVVSKLMRAACKRD